MTQQSSEMANNKNIQAFLLTIRRSEGTDGPDGYYTMFGGRKFDSFTDHPKKYFTYTDLSGKTIITSAAGAYQIIYSVWTVLKTRLGLSDFSPESQDMAATELIAEAHALDSIIAGRLNEAIYKVRTIWASLPGSNSHQPQHALQEIEQWYLEAGGFLEK
ncbi:MAG TPA: glycoside hydrolase family 104 protein [Candidatus Babeliaceae bacterium]|nr:glycoside hydrolase family 104 protein [Candidatus Babeliaceae bacterium]